jgi:5-methylcytosine-specific restriction endonuclease McrA
MASAKKRWNAANPEKVRKHRRDARKRNPKHIDTLNRAYRKRNPILMKAINCNVIARWRYGKKNLDTKKLAALMIAANGACQYCGAIDRKLSFDHRFPFVKGGTHTLRNIAICCINCNSSKQGKTLAEFKKYAKRVGKTIII